jgi:hypothetical protein
MDERHEAVPVDAGNVVHAVRGVDVRPRGQALDRHPAAGSEDQGAGRDPRRAGGGVVAVHLRRAYGRALAA